MKEETKIYAVQIPQAQLAPDVKIEANSVYIAKGKDPYKALFNAIRPLTYNGQRTQSARTALTSTIRKKLLGKTDIAGLVRDIGETIERVIDYNKKKYGSLENATIELGLELTEEGVSTDEFEGFRLAESALKKYLEIHKEAAT